MPANARRRHGCESIGKSDEDTNVTITVCGRLAVLGCSQAAFCEAGHFDLSPKKRTENGYSKRNNNIISNSESEVNAYMTKNSDTRQDYFMTKRIGSTLFRVRVVFDDTASESVEDKILRMIRNEGLESETTCGMMDTPQVSRPA